MAIWIRGGVITIHGTHGAVQILGHVTTHGTAGIHGHLTDLMEWDTVQVMPWDSLQGTTTVLIHTTGTILGGPVKPMQTARITLAEDLVTAEEVLEHSLPTASDLAVALSNRMEDVKEFDLLVAKMGFNAHLNLAHQVEAHRPETIPVLMITVDLLIPMRHVRLLHGLTTANKTDNPAFVGTMVQDLRI